MLRPAFRKLLCGLLLTGLLLALVGCDVRRVDPVLKIGLVAPFEGEQRTIGYDVIYSARLAVREINAAGGVGGYRLSLVAFDDSGYTDEARSVAQALIVDPGIIAVIGHWQPQTTAAAEPLYASADLGLVPMGRAGLGAFDPAPLAAEWRTAYQAITFQGAQPPGLFAASAYDGMQLIRAAIAQAAATGDVTRESVSNALQTVTITGLTGEVALP